MSGAYWDHRTPSTAIAVTGRGELTPGERAAIETLAAEYDGELVEAEGRWWITIPHHHTWSQCSRLLRRELEAAGLIES